MNTPIVNFLDNVWNMYKKHACLMINAFILPVALIFISTQSFDLLSAISNKENLSLVMFIQTTVFIFGILLMLVAQVGVITALSKGHTSHVDAFENYKIGFDKIPDVLFLIILNFFTLIGSVPFLIFPLVWVVNYFTIFSLVVDGKKGFDAVAESYSLVRINLFGVFGRFVLLLAVMFGVYLISSGVILTLTEFFNYSPLAISLMKTASSLLSSLFFGPLILVYVYNIFKDLKESDPAHVHVAENKKAVKWFKAFFVIGFFSVLAVVLFVALIAMVKFCSVFTC